MILRVLNLILIVITFGLVEIIDTVTYDEIDNNITVTGYEDYTYRDIFGNKDITLQAIGTATDRYYLSGNIWQKEQNIAVDTTVVNAATTWNVSSNLTNTILFYKTNLLTLFPTIVDISDNALIANISLSIDSSSFEVVDRNHINSVDTERVTITNYTDNRLYIRVLKSRLSGITSGDFETYLQANDVTFTYELATAIYIDIFDFTGHAVPTIEQFETMLTEYERMLALQPYEQATTTTNTLDMTDLIISLVSLLCWYGVIKVWKGVRK